MHIPDGWLSIQVSLLTWSLTLIIIGYILSQFDRNDLERLSNIGAIASVVFVAQMFNFPVIGGTSGHLLGASLSVYLVGFPGAILTLFVVLLVQAVIFADGGLLALGANTFNMGIVGSFVVYIVLKLYPKFQNKDNRKIFLIGVFITSLLAVLFSSFLAGIELVLSNQVSLGTAIPLILGWHLLIGIGEGILTVFVISYLLQVDYPIFDQNTGQMPLLQANRQSNRPIIGLGVLLFILSILSLFASSSPDGLEFAGITLELPEGNTYSAGIADDYAFLGNHTGIGMILSALLGITIIAGFFFLPAIYIKEQRETVTT